MPDQLYYCGTLTSMSRDAFLGMLSDVYTEYRERSATIGSFAYRCYLLEGQARCELLIRSHAFQFTTRNH